MDNKFNEIFQTIGIILIITFFCSGMFIIWYLNGCTHF